MIFVRLAGGLLPAGASKERSHISGSYMMVRITSPHIATHRPAIAARDELIGNADLGVYAVSEHYLVTVPVSDTQIVIALIRQTCAVPPL